MASVATSPDIDFGKTVDRLLHECDKCDYQPQVVHKLSEAVHKALTARELDQQIKNQNLDKLYSVLYAHDSFHMLKSPTGGLEPSTTLTTDEDTDHRDSRATSFAESIPSPASSYPPSLPKFDDNDNQIDGDEVIEQIGFDILDAVLPFVVDHGNKNGDKNTVSQHAAELLQTICEQCHPREIFLSFLSFIESDDDLENTYQIFPYIERSIQRVTNHKRADMLEQLFHTVMKIWRKHISHEDDTSVKFVNLLCDTLDSLTTSLTRLEDEPEHYEREQGILMSVVLRCAQWLLAEHWDTLVQDNTPRKIRRYASAEENENKQKQFQMMLVERVPSLIRCVVHCGKIGVVLQALEQTLSPDTIGKEFVTNPNSPNGKSAFQRVGSLQYSTWSLPGVSAITALMLALAQFQDTMGHDNAGVRAPILIAIDQARAEVPLPQIPSNRPLLLLQCYPLLLVLLADSHRHAAYTPLCIHFWNLLQSNIAESSLSLYWLKQQPEAHNRSFWLLFELAVNAVMQIHNASLRHDMVRILRQMIGLFEPEAQFEVLERGILNVPAPSIAALLVSELKDQVHTALSVKRNSTSTSSLYQASMHERVYNSERVTALLVKVLNATQQNFENQLDVLIAVLNFVRYILLRKQEVAKQLAENTPSLRIRMVRLHMLEDPEDFYHRHLAWIPEAVQPPRKQVKTVQDVQKIDSAFGATEQNSSALQLTLLLDLHDRVKELLTTTSS